MNTSKVLVVAHADDEILWFSSHAKEAKLIIIATESEDDRLLTAYPFKEKTINLKLPDIYENRLISLDTKIQYSQLFIQLSNVIKEFMKTSDKIELITHAPFGDIHEHWHHQDVCASCAILAKDNSNISLFTYAGSRCLRVSHPRFLNDEEMSEKIRLLDNYTAQVVNLFSNYPITRDESITSISPIEVLLYYYRATKYNYLKGVDDFWNFKDSEWEQKRYDMMVDTVSRYSKLGVLDIGAYTGLFLDRLTTVPNKYGIDIIEEYSNILKEKGYAVTPEMEIDVVTIFSTLEYVNSFENIIREYSKFNPSYYIVGVNSQNSYNELLTTYEQHIVETKILPAKLRIDSTYLDGYVTYYQLVLKSNK